MIADWSSRYNFCEMESDLITLYKHQMNSIDPGSVIGSLQLWWFEGVCFYDRKYICTFSDD